MIERLQKIIASRGLTSRRKAEEWIRDGKVTVNGKIAGLGDGADPDQDDIRVDGVPLPSAGEYMYIMLNKPRGFVTTLSDEKGRRNAAQLVEDCGTRVYPIGRLDMDSEGLLLFTNDGEFANMLMHPKHEVEKTYEVWVSGFYTGAEELLKKPVTLDGYTIRPPAVRLISAEGNRAKLQIVIHEGRNRQIRRMCAMVDLDVTRLRRISEGPVSLGNLKLGSWRNLTVEEIEALRK